MSSESHTAYGDPRSIERRSFEIIRSELGRCGLGEVEESVLVRVIHATADFDFASNLHFTEGACERGVDALAHGADVVCDTQMAASGINRRGLLALGGATHVFVGDEDVAREARERHVTRSVVATERASKLAGPCIFAIGNAPTALLRLCELVETHEMEVPALTIGTPVGFVNVIEAKQALERARIPAIVARGRKGGSTVAVAIVNALILAARARHTPLMERPTNG